MKSNVTRACFGLFISALSAWGQTVPAVPPTTPPGLVFNPTVTRTATIQLASLVIDESIHPPQGPLIFAPGTHLQLVAPATNFSRPVATWYRGQTLLSSTSTTLDIPSASAADAGSYSVAVTSADDSTARASSLPVQIAIAPETQRLINISSRMHVDPTHPAIVGFVVDESRGNVFLLVRVVGPGLAKFDITDPMPTPVLSVTNAQGVVRAPFAQRGQNPPPMSAPFYPTVENTAPRVGGFPLDVGSADVANLYLLTPGNYTAQVRSGDNSAGEVLVEIYQVPI